MVDDFVPAEVVQERMAQLLEVVERHGLTRHEARVGRVEEALVEGPSKRNADVLAGRTRQNKLVHFAPERGVNPGDLVDVAITQAAPHWLRGDIVGEPRPGRAARRRIPVTVE